jgi:hypothetical protein
MPPEVERSIEVLQRTPTALAGLLGGGLSDFWARGTYGPDTFSPFDVVGHLLHAERTNWMPRARRILAADPDGAATGGASAAGGAPAATFDPFDRYAMYETSRGRSIDELLSAFAAERSASVAELRAMDLTPADLDRRGTHPELGPVALRHLLAAWAVHDLGHVHQVAKAMAHQYRDAVGPWRAYLTILPREGQGEA